MNESQLTQQEFEQFQLLIMKLSGINVQENKITLLSNRIRRRLRATKTPDFQSYLSLLKSPAGKEEFEDFLSVVTTNETSFFRTEKHFDWLRTSFVDEIAGRIREGKRPRRIRIWSAACSSGEEPYSIAICMAENQFKLPGCQIEILGTDISEHVLSKARAGLFDDKVLDEVPEKMKSRYFSHKRDSENWEVKPALKNLVKIERHNLMDPYRLTGFDCIFIRNVLIYFSRESKRVVIDNLVSALAPGGYLVVGPSEGIFDMLGMLKKCSTFLYTKEQ